MGLWPPIAFGEGSDSDPGAGDQVGPFLKDPSRGPNQKARTLRQAPVEHPLSARCALAVRALS
jgi:hypothetical protein